MSNGITLKNPVVNSVPPSITTAKRVIDDNGRSLSTGKKANIDVVSSFLGNGLADKANVLSKVLESMGYSANVLRVTQDSLSSMSTTLSDMLALSSQNGGSDTAIRSLNDILQQKIEQLKTHIKTADYDGRKLLDGDLGSDSSVRTKFLAKPVSVNSYTAVTSVANGAFALPATAAVIGKTAITVNSNNIATGAAGDKITIGTSNFTFVGASPDFSKNEILKGLTDVETTKNIVTAIRNSPDENLRYYDVDLFNKSVVISQRSAGSAISLTTNVSSSGNALVATAPSTQTLTFTTAQAAATDTVTIAGLKFVFGGAVPGNPLSVDPGANHANSATNLFTAINDHPVTKDLIDRGLLNIRDNAAGILTIQSAGGSVMIGDAATGISRTAAAPGNITVAVPTADSTAYNAAMGGIDVSGIKNIDGFIGQLTSTVTVTDYARGNGPATALYSRLNGGIALVAVGGNDTTVALTATIAGKSFQALVFLANGGNMNGAVIEFKGEAGSFKVKGNGGFAPDITTEVNARDNLAGCIKQLLDSASFVQNRDLTINTDAGDVVVDGASIASVEGMTVSLNSDKFADRNFEDFSIETSTDRNGVKLTAVISGTSFVADNLNTQGLVEGLALKLRPVGGGSDVLTINLGKGGLTSLNQTVNYQPIAKAIKASLTSSGSGIDVRVGLGFDDSLKVQIPDVSISKIFRDNSGKFVEKLSVLSPADARVAQEVLTNALNSISSALSKVKGQSETIDSASESLSSAIAVTKDAASGYLDTDLVESASAFSAALKSILAAISTLQAGARVADAGLEIIKSAAA